MRQECHFRRSNEYLRSKFTAQISRAEVALRMGVPRNVVSQWISETDPRPLPLDKIVAMAVACPGVKVEELLILRLSEEMGHAEMEVLLAMKLLLSNPDPDAAFDACATLARASYDAEAQLARMIEEEAYYEKYGRPTLTEGSTRVDGASE